MTDPAAQPIPAPPDPFAHRRGEPRTFIALWIVLLFASIAITLGGVGMLGLLATDVYRPAARRLLLIVMAACVLVWPMLRLSQTPPRRVAGAFLVDALAVLVPLQAIIWPQSFPWMAAWPWEVSACVALWFGAWTFAAAGALSWFFAGSVPACPRWTMMLLFVAAALAGPIAAGLRPVGDLDADLHRSFDGWLMTSPLSGVWELTQDRSWTGDAARVVGGHWWAVGVAWLVTTIAWTAAARRASAAAAHHPARPADRP